MALRRLRTRRGSEHMVDSQPSQLRQDTPEMLLELDAFLAPPATVLLKAQSSSPLALEIWQANERNPAMYDLALIGDSQQLEKTVRVETPRLLADSHWARIRHQQEELKTTGSQVVLPLRTPHAAVYKLVQALYTLSVQLAEDVEAVLLLASSMQIELLESACVRYLLSLKLPARQLAQLSLLLSRLMKMDALHQTLQRLVQLPWMGDVVSILPIVLKHLFSGSPSSYARELETLNEMLHSPTCGAFSELQVFDVLTSADISQDSLIFSTLFCPERIPAPAFPPLLRHIDSEVASRPLLNNVFRQLQVVNAGPYHWYQDSPDRKAYFLELTHSSQTIGQVVEQAVLFTVQPQPPFVQPLCRCSFAVSDRCAAFKHSSDFVAALRAVRQQYPGDFLMGLWVRERSTDFSPTSLESA